jgi:hypothetical protein
LKKNQQKSNIREFSGMIPPYRQTFYMYKDILIDEAQALMAANLVNLCRTQKYSGSILAFSCTYQV